MRKGEKEVEWRRQSPVKKMIIVKQWRKVELTQTQYKCLSYEMFKGRWEEEVKKGKKINYEGK